MVHGGTRRVVVALVVAALGLSVLATAAGGATPTRQTTVAVGGSHACALSSTGIVKCWGLNNSGQVGNGADGGVVSQPVSVLTGAIAITAGDNHTCAVLKAMTVKCWGQNDAGEIGNGTRGDAVTRPTSVKGVGGTGLLSGVIALAAGGDHTCALLNTATVKCWGQNNEGVLGNGSIKNSSTPVSANGLLRVTAISMSAQVACALLKGGTVKCWGYTGDGQLGAGTTGPQDCSFGEFDFPCSKTPMTVQGVSGATGISVGQNHTCALLTSARVECWGVNTHNAKAPIVQRGLVNVKQVSTSGANEDHSCARLQNGTVQCFSYNAPNGAQLPVTVPGLSQVAVLSVGGQFNCAVLTAGTVKCWNNGTTTPKPVLVTGL